MCVRRAYAYSPQRGVDFCIHLDSFCRTWAGVFPSTNRVISSAEKEVKEGRSELSCEPLKFDSEPIKYHFGCGALTYDVELITKDPGTCGKTVWTHTRSWQSARGFRNA